MSFQSKEVSFVITTPGETKEATSLIKWIEKGRNYQRWIWITLKEMDWIKECVEVANSSWSYVRKEVFEGNVLIAAISNSRQGRFLRLSKVRNGRSRSIFIPERNHLKGWNFVADAMARSSSRVQRRTFAEVVTGVLGKDECDSLKEVVIDTRMKTSIMQLLNRSVVIKAWSVEGWRYASNLMHKHGIGEKQGRNYQWWWLGDDAMLVDCGDQNQVTSMIVDWSKEEGEVECCLQRWHPYTGYGEESNLKNQFWVIIKGVPTHLWEDSVFERLVENWGKIIEWDDSAWAKRELTRRRILLEGKIESLPSLVALRWGDLIYEICLQVEWNAAARIGLALLEKTASPTTMATLNIDRGGRSCRGSRQS